MRAGRYLFVFSCLAGMLVAGCGDGKKSVKVRVLKDGAPLGGVAVILYTQAGGSVGGSVTDGEGNVTVTALPGEYKVTASKKDFGPPQDPKGMFKMVKKGPMGKMVTDPAQLKGEELAAEFTQVDKTTLRLKIPADKEPVELTVQGKK